MWALRLPLRHVLTAKQGLNPKLRAHFLKSHGLARTYLQNDACFHETYLQNDARIDVKRKHGQESANCETDMSVELQGLCSPIEKL